VPGPAVVLRGALLALQALAPDAVLPGVELLGERAALLGLSRRGEVSCGGATRLLPARDGAVALSLARPDDVDLVPALVEGPVTDPWEAVASWLSRTPAGPARDRAVLLGLPVGLVGESSGDLPWVVLSQAAGPTPARARPLVVDLSALWAGPLCASLLSMAGCDVVKVEDVRRPDGARRGPAAFFDLLNGTARQVTLDLATPGGRAELRRLLAGADVVIEASRPRALAALGCAAEDVVAAATSLTWVSITAHGRDQDRVGFGDDAAAAGGLVHDGCFVADAVADPMTGVHAAVAALAGVLEGGTRLVDVALSRTAAVAAGVPRPQAEVARRDGRWWVETAAGPVPVAEPRTRLSAGRAGSPPAG
jgi:hypothetical protein